MYRLLIIEDDHTIRKGLVKIIQKMELPLADIVEAENGLDALKVTAEYKPHIVITDIKMPLMNGLAFIEQVKKTNPEIKFIIISGYSEFSFAQKAISYNVSEYLLKPIEKEKLSVILNRLLEQLERENEENLRKEKSEEKLREYYSNILKEILEGYHSTIDLDFTLSNAGVSCKKEYMAILSLYCKSNIQLLMNILDNCRYQLDVLFRYTYNQNTTICLINIDKPVIEVLPDLINQLIIKPAGDRKADVYCGLSECCIERAELPGLVRHSKKALAFRLTNALQHVHTYSEIKDIQVTSPALNAFYQEMSNAINAENPYEINMSIDHLFNFLYRLSPLTPDLIKNSIDNFIVYHMSQSKRSYVKMNFNMEDICYSAETLASLQLNIKQIFQSICINKNDTLSANHTNRINTVIKYIEINYHKNISLEEVAKYININACYLSNMFKRETGMYFSDYLQKIRIEKSKVLLMQPQYRIYEVAESVGFLDEKYYYKIFKKLTGVTPNQYRNKIYAKI